MYVLISQLLVNGIVTASLYALYGVSWGIIYRTTKIFHFSHHLVFATAGYTAALVTEELGLHYIFAFVAAVIWAVVLGCSVDRFLYRTLRKLHATQTTTFLSSMGFATAGIGLILLILSSNPRPLKGFPVKILSLGPATFTSVDLIMVLVSWLVVFLLLIFLAKSTYGKAIRAVGSNPEMAKNLGLSIDNVYTVVFAIGSAIFGVGAFLFTAKNCAFPMMGMLPFFMSFTAVFMGGVTSISGHAVAGFILGMAETLGMVFLPGEYKIMIVFGILLVVVIIKPEGLLSIRRG
jgi:branched-chain amino acid transport system permease protein